MGRRLGYLTVRRALALGCVAAVAVLVTAAVASGGHKQPVGAVYTETNSPAGNSVVVYDRFDDGTLAKRQAVSTGGNGSTQAVGCGPGCPILDSQNEVLVSDDGNLVFAVNAGSNTVSSFREGHNGLEFVSQVSSGGVMPESMALKDHSLYVLNVATTNSNGTTGNVYGLKVGGDGQLSPLGTSQTLASAAPPDHSADPRAMEISPNGKVVVVTEIAGGFQTAGPGNPPGRIDTLVVGPHGELSPAVAHPSQTGFPFGFAFEHNHKIVVSEINDPTGQSIGSVATYEVKDDGSVTPIDHKSSGGVLPCWVAVSKDGHTTWVVNTGAGFPASISSFGLKHGFLTPLGLTPPTAGEFARTDENLSRDGKYLYVLAPQVGPPLQASHIDEYSVGKNGQLTFIGATPAGDNLGIGASGLSAR
jgi:hypothetical protein